MLVLPSDHSPVSFTGAWVEKEKPKINFNATNYEWTEVIDF